MTLRTRIAAIASLSVALAVLAAAVGLYVAVRADLRGEIDRALSERAQAFGLPPAAGPAGGPGGGSPGGGGPGGVGLGDGSGAGAGGGPDGGGSSTGEAYAGGGYGGPGGFPATVQPAPLGAESGYVQFISSRGTVRVP